MSGRGVHITHCCILPGHGCKYGDDDCPVALGQVKQERLCQYCDFMWEKSESQRKLQWDKIERLFNKISNNYEKWESKFDFIDAKGYPREVDPEEAWDGALETVLDYFDDKEDGTTVDDKKYSYQDILDLVLKLKD